MATTTNELADLIHAALLATSNAAYLNGRDGGADDLQRQQQRQDAHAAANEANITMWRAFYEHAAENTPPF